MLILPIDLCYGNCFQYFHFMKINLLLMKVNAFQQYIKTIMGVVATLYT